MTKAELVRWNSKESRRGRAAALAFREAKAILRRVAEARGHTHSMTVELVCEELERLAKLNEPRR